MERFYNNEDPDDFDDDFEGELNGEEPVAFIDKSDILEVMHMDLAQTELDQQLLNHAHKIASADIFWFFRSTAAKMDRVEEVYRRLMSITTEGDKEIEIEEKG